MTPITRAGRIFVADFLRGFEFDAFAHDLKTLYATTRALEIISEASRRLPDDLKGSHPQIIWKEMRGADNVYRHNYEEVVASLVWKTAVESLPPHLAIVEAELAAADRETGRSEGS